MIKALFLDIDGTLVSFRTHRMQASTIDALTRAKANGVKVFISTGRPLDFITNLGDIAHLIDGYITTNGSYNFIGGNVISSHIIDKDEVETLVRLAREWDFAAVVIGAEDVAVVNPKEVIDRLFVRGLDIAAVHHTVPIERVMQQDILQITPFIPQELQDRLMPLIPHCMATRWHPEFIDITHLQATKGNALIDIAAHENIPTNHTMAFGDGENDISILTQAGVGVAMGNADGTVKAAADYVTTSVDDDGIARALAHFNVI